MARPHYPSPQPLRPLPKCFELELARLHEECLAELMIYAVSIIRCRDAARDAVQEAFLRYFVEQTHGRVVEYPRAWLYRVARNYLLDRMEGAAKKHEVSQDHAIDLPDQNHGPEDTLRCAQTAQQLTSMLSRKEMECLRLRANGLSYEEIGGVLCVRPGTVSAFLTRAHKKLRMAARHGGYCRSETSEALIFLIWGGSNSLPS
jgi:RNA polymerase sigma factor (sigma-70 family)